MNINDDFRLAEREGLCRVCANMRFGANEDDPCKDFNFECKDCTAECPCKDCDRSSNHFNWRGNADLRKEK